MFGYVLQAGKAVVNPLEIALLNSIVDSILEQCDKEFDNLLSMTKYTQISSKDAEIIINRIIDHLNDDYDKRSQETLKRTLPSLKDNYNEGGKDNLEIRKRILNRALQEKKAKLLQMICAKEQITTQQELPISGNVEPSVKSDRTNIETHADPPPPPSSPSNIISPSTESEILTGPLPGILLMYY